jgi:hypothetical protein
MPLVNRYVLPFRGTRVNRLIFSCLFSFCYLREGRGVVLSNLKFSGYSVCQLPRQDQTNIVSFGFYVENFYVIFDKKRYPISKIDIILKSWFLLSFSNFHDCFPLNQRVQTLLVFLFFIFVSVTTPVYRNTLYYYIVSFLQSNDIISGTLANVMGRQCVFRICREWHVQTRKQ